MENKETNKLGIILGVMMLATIIILSIIVVEKTIDKNFDEAKFEELSKHYYDEMNSYYYRITLSDLEDFASDLDFDYFYIESIEPHGFIDINTMRDGFSVSSGFRNILYNVSIRGVNRINETSDVTTAYLTNYTKHPVMNFEVAISNDFEPMEPGYIYEIYYVYHSYNYFNVIYYEKIRMDMIWSDYD